ncbi:hypothetical protein BGX34_003860 [Mortierella sp. NVP85]|nr:hypothetical protein BGX34_003860 [Mortierella sp. NVP85]
MQSPHPLEIPELVSLVIAYLPPSRLPAYARVSKLWYQVCSPIIWKDINLIRLPESTALIQRCCHVVKKVTIGSLSQESAAIRFPNLGSLELNTEFRKDFHIQFVMAHPTITDLVMNDSYCCQPPFWDALLGFHNLRTLSMSSHEIFGQNIDKFWQLCMRLERLDIQVQHNRFPRVILPEKELSNIKHIGVNGCYANNIPLFIEFLRRCPGLTSLRWRSRRRYEKAFVSKFSTFLEAHELFYLEHLDLGARLTPRELLTKVIRNMPQITTLSLMATYYMHYRIDFAALQPYFTSLRVLELFLEKGVDTHMAQDILSSCPLLEKLVAPCVDADVITQGKPWVCLELRFLELAFCFIPPNTVSTLQPLVFDRLSKLTQLEEWRIIGSSHLGGHVDLRIQSGLDKLSTLRELHTVIAYDVVEMMGDAEVDWIVNHWKRLRVFNGKLNTCDAVGEALRRRMWDRGISVIR